MNKIMNHWICPINDVLILISSAHQSIHSLPISSTVAGVSRHALAVRRWCKAPKTKVWRLRGWYISFGKRWILVTKVTKMFFQKLWSFLSHFILISLGMLECYGMLINFRTLGCFGLLCLSDTVKCWLFFLGGGTFGNSTRDGKGPPSDNAVPEASFLNSV